ncbi:MAG: 50S ribosomal protein L4 [Patescibacteria group bacterium]|nr:50S ribosomal protein L4 [Patescibacteria group bacterium]
METTVYNQEGKETGKVTLPEQLFGLPWNSDLVHQVVVGMQANLRTNTAVAKGRGVVRGGGRKPWRQKGTGRARHGSIRSPLWRGGGVTHGPTAERDYHQKINHKMRNKALLTVLSQKQRDGELVFVDRLEITAPKTGMAQQAVNKLGRATGHKSLTYRNGKRVLFLVPQSGEALTKSFHNLPGAAIEEVRNLNPLNALTYQYLIFADPESGLPVLESRAGLNEIKSETKVKAKS